VKRAFLLYVVCMTLVLAGFAWIFITLYR